MDPLSSIKPENETTCYIIYELVRRGHRVMTLTSAEVISRNGHLVGKVREIKGATPDLA
ncbi:MAG: glutathione synthase, partial [Deltaproteobacteria bacterium]|nr:glutathione synthase [Deltaproteobacteria bacterium]